MAQYKVPQDVEADDKLLGPFSFRQFVYLLVAAGCIALAVAFFQLFPMLAIIPALPAIFFIILALPLKKDQPMETYLAAIVSYYLKPHTRVWTPGQKESTITITVPKIVEENRTRDISGEEATHRLSFLANIVDTEGRAIKGMGVGPVNDELVAEANSTTDMFETGHFERLETTIAKDETERHEVVMKEMRNAIARSENMNGAVIQKHNTEEEEKAEPQQSTQMAETVEKSHNDGPDFKSSVVVDPKTPEERIVENFNIREEKTEEKVETTTHKPSIIELASNTDFSVATIAKEANRINRKDNGEVFISLH